MFKHRLFKRLFSAVLAAACVAGWAAPSMALRPAANPEKQAGSEELADSLRPPPAGKDPVDVELNPAQRELYVSMREVFSTVPPGVSYRRNRFTFTPGSVPEVVLEGPVPKDWKRWLGILPTNAGTPVVITFQFEEHRTSLQFLPLEEGEGLKIQVPGGAGGAGGLPVLAAVAARLLLFQSRAGTEEPGLVSAEGIRETFLRLWGEAIPVSEGLLPALVQYFSAEQLRAIDPQRRPRIVAVVAGGTPEPLFFGRIFQAVSAAAREDSVPVEVIDVGEAAPPGFIPPIILSKGQEGYPVAGAVLVGPGTVRLFSGSLQGGAPLSPVETNRLIRLFVERGPEFVGNAARLFEPEPAAVQLPPQLSAPEIAGALLPAVQAAFAVPPSTEQGTTPKYVQGGTIYLAPGLRSDPSRAVALELLSLLGFSIEGSTGASSAAAPVQPDLGVVPAEDGSVVVSYRRITGSSIETSSAKLREQGDLTNAGSLLSESGSRQTAVAILVAQVLDAELLRQALVRGAVLQVPREARQVVVEIGPKGRLRTALVDARRAGRVLAGVPDQSVPPEELQSSDALTPLVAYQINWLFHVTGLSPEQIGGISLVAVRSGPDSGIAQAVSESLGRKFWGNGIKNIRVVDAVAAAAVAEQVQSRDSAVVYLRFSPAGVSAGFLPVSGSRFSVLDLSLGVPELSTPEQRIVTARRLGEAAADALLRQLKSSAGAGLGRQPVQVVVHIEEDLNFPEGLLAFIQGVGGGFRAVAQRDSPAVWRLGEVSVRLSAIPREQAPLIGAAAQMTGLESAVETPAPVLSQEQLAGLEALAEQRPALPEGVSTVPASGAMGGPHATGIAAAVALSPLIPVVFVVETRQQAAGLKALGFSPNVIFRIGSAAYPDKEKARAAALNQLRVFGASSILELGTEGSVNQTMLQLLERIGIKLTPENVAPWQSFFERLLEAFSKMA